MSQQPDLDSRYFNQSIPPSASGQSCDGADTALRALCKPVKSAQTDQTTCIAPQPQSSLAHAVYDHSQSLPPQPEEFENACHEQVPLLPSDPEYVSRGSYDAESWLTGASLTTESPPLQQPRPSNSHSNDAHDPSSPDARSQHAAKQNLLPFEPVERETSIVSAPDQTALAISSGEDKPRAAIRNWSPWSLRIRYQITLLCFTALLLIGVIVVHCTSELNSGLRNDNGNGRTPYIWRFGPTLLAVLQNSAITLLTDDVKRTEPFAHLSSPFGALARDTILKSSKMWFTALMESLPKQKTGHKGSPATALSIILFIISLLVVSPLSATLIVSQNVAFSETVPFRRFTLPTKTPLQFDPKGPTYFRTIGHALQNATTSAWISDKYVLLPSWPDTFTSIPLGAVISNEEQIWQAPTTVLQSEMTCGPMTISERGFRKINFDSNGNSNQSSEGRKYRFISVVSPQGCTHEMASDVDDNFPMTGAWISWSKYDGLSAIRESEGPSALETFSRCPPADFIFFSDGWGSDQDLRVSTQMCSARYFMADLTARVIMGLGNSIVDFDEQEFVKNRVPLRISAVDIEAFEKVFYASWSEYFTSAGRPLPIGLTNGPASVVFALSDSNISSVLSNISWVDPAAHFKQRFFGETVHEALLAQEQPSSQIDKGTVSTSRRRIKTVASIAIALEIALASQIIVMILLLMATRLSRWPLQLSGDPATVTATVSVLTGEHTPRSALHGKTFWTLPKLHECMDHHHYKLEAGHLRLDISSRRSFETPRLESISSPRSQSKEGCEVDSARKEWQKPVIFRRWLLLGFSFLLICIPSVLVVLHFHASDGGLHQAAFVYRTPWEKNGAPEAISPASVITTLLAISVGLWWGSLDSTLRRLQPFLAMTNGPKSGTNGPGLSYQSSYPLWTVLRAAKRSHWLLTMVCFGTFMTQILTVSMSALWYRSSGTMTFESQLLHHLQLRQVPKIFTGYPSMSPRGGNTAAADALANLFTDRRTNWLYSASIALSLNGSDPPWSQKGWSFVPVDLESIPLQDDPKLQAYLNHRSRSAYTESDLAVPRINTNVSLNTAAIRARIDCTPHDTTTHPELWLTVHNLSDSKKWNPTTIPADLHRAWELGYGAGPVGSPGYEQFVFASTTISSNTSGPSRYTGFFANDKRITCCADNSTNTLVGEASIGYWSPNMNDYAREQNFTVKWIHGTTVSGIREMPEANWHNDDVPYSRLLWSAAPKMTALDCAPIIETANASLMVDYPSGQVLDFTIRDDIAQDAFAWSDVFVIRGSTDLHDFNNESIPIYMSISHGVLFLSALLDAADVGDLVGAPSTYGEDLENTSELTFTIRSPGLNLDYMSYSMLSQVDGDRNVLLDPERLNEVANLVFSTYFQHYVSSNLSMTEGGWAYSPINETIPDDLAAIKSDVDTRISHSPTQSVFYGNQSTSLHFTVSVEILQMSKSALWVSLGVFCSLLIILAVVFLRSSKMFRGLLRDIETPAEIAILVIQSRWLSKMDQQDHQGHQAGESPCEVQLGWHKSPEGRDIWGFEMTRSCDESEQEEMMELDDLRLNLDEAEEQRSITP